MPILAVIDMQPHFSTANKEKTILGVMGAIITAKKRRWPIFIVEYAMCGSTWSSIFKTLGKYQKYEVIQKAGDDGSQEILNACKILKWNSDHFYLAGVNGNACVARTATGLLTKGVTSIRLIKDAINCKERNPVRWMGGKRNNSPRLAVI